MKLKVLRATIVAGKETFGPGQVFVMKDKIEAQSLIDRGFAEAADSKDQPAE